MLFMLVQAIASPAPVAPPAPPAPPLMVPSMVRTGYPGDPSAPLRRVPVDIVVRSAQNILWTGSLVVGNRGPSGWTQSRSEPADPACAVRGNYNALERDSLNLNLGLTGLPDDPSVRVNVTVRWSRTGEGPCAGLRTVELNQIATLPDRTLVQIRGDGSLVVELRRR